MKCEKWTYKPDRVYDEYERCIAYVWYCVRGTVQYIVDKKDNIDDNDACACKEIEGRGGLVRDVIAENARLKARVEELEGLTK